MSIERKLRRMIENWPSQVIGGDRVVSSSIQEPKVEPEVLQEAITRGIVGTFVSQLSSADHGKTYYYLK